jgi:antitoxin (DNA-binding transcriptional repressor) of toxin-antitoxin stability system
MESTIKATEAVRGFSELLNNIKYKGEHYTILRGGKPVALIGPVKTPPEIIHLKDLKRLMEEIPSLGSEAETFAKDIKAIIGSQPNLPGEGQWE